MEHDERCRNVPIQELNVNLMLKREVRNTEKIDFFLRLYEYGNLCSDQFNEVERRSILLGVHRSRGHKYQ